MKKIILGVICLLFCQTGFGQENTFQKEWAFGVNGGVTLSKVRFFSALPQDMLLQKSGGLTVRFVSEKHFGIQTELNYSLRGWKEKTDTVANLSKYSRSIAYLEAPILSYIYFDLGKRVRLIFTAGPQIGCKIGEKELEREIIKSPNEADEEHKRKLNGYYNQKIQRPFDYGITGGMGLELRTGIGHFILDGRYYFGLSDVFNNKRSDYFQSSANQVIGVKLTYLFEVKGGR